MPELIDKAKALKYLTPRIQTKTPYGEGYNRALEDAAELVTLMPTIEAEPVRHGRWETWGYVFHGIEWKRCSCCGKCADVSYYGLLDGEIKMSTPAICGGCGADMREGGADNG